MNIKMIENEALLVKVGNTLTKTYAVSLTELLANYSRDIKLKNIFEIYFSIDEDGELIDIEILK
jgi:hypothetical protein